MDEKTRKELLKITMGVPSRLGRKLMRQEVNTATEDLVKEYLRDHGNEIPAKLRQDMELLLEVGAFRTVNDVVDPAITKELDRYHEAMVSKARKQGKLADPAKDEWLRRHMAKMSKRYGKK